MDNTVLILHYPWA